MSMKNYVEGDTVKICGHKYNIHIGFDGEMRLEDESEFDG